jgi:FkbM family methyltransferase
MLLDKIYKRVVKISKILGLSPVSKFNIYKTFLSVRGSDPTTGLKINVLKNLVRIGTDYGGCVIPKNYLTAESICYCAGIGEDSSFDLGLIDKYSCKVYAIDPTPRSIIHAREIEKDNPNYIFCDVGLWNEDTILKFYSPEDTSHVSHSILNIQNTDTYFEAKVDSLSNIMKQFQHQKIDLLKLNIEGAEYRVIDSIIEDIVDVSIICVEFHGDNNKRDDLYIEKATEYLTKLEKFGYVLIFVDNIVNYILIKKEEYLTIIGASK